MRTRRIKRKTVWRTQPYRPRPRTRPENEGKVTPKRAKRQVSRR